MTLDEGQLQGEALLRSGLHAEHTRVDAEFLLRHVLGKNLAWLMAHRSDQLSISDAEHYAKLLERRALGEPIQYIVGEQEFYGLPLLVAPDVLIPRPETEHLVEKTLELVPRFQHPRIVDVGTGSGAIAIALAHNVPQAAIVAIDISGPALAMAQNNAQRLGLAERIRFLQGDLLAPVREERFDFVVSNPPYVPLIDRDSLSAEVREHEPALALFAGQDGLDIYRRLIPDALLVLELGGFLLMEIGYGQAEAIRLLLLQAGFQGIEFVPDLQGISRVACAQRPR